MSFGTLNNHKLSLQKSNIWVCEVLIYSGLHRALHFKHEIELIMSLSHSLSVSPSNILEPTPVDPNQGRSSCLFVWLTQSHRRLCSLSPLLKTLKGWTPGAGRNVNMSFDESLHICATYDLVNQTGSLRLWVYSITKAIQFQVQFICDDSSHCKMKN